MTAIGQSANDDLSMLRDDQLGEIYERGDPRGDIARNVRTSLRDFATHALAPAGHAPARHHLVMIDALEAMAHGETKRLMLLMPPGSAKSTYASLLFPAWWIAQNPAGSLITASHTASLAEHFGRGVRGLLATHAGRLDLNLRQDARAAGRFTTNRGGEYFAIGVHGAVTGRRGDLVLIDDPVRSVLDAESLAARDRLWDWYRAELVTRLKPKAMVVLIMTRWHIDDLAGRLIEQGDWTVLRLPALAETNDPLDRGPGEALWPAWEDRDELLKKQATLGERSFAALFQQGPLPEAGRLFDLSKVPLTDSVPDGVAVRAWDLASGGDHRSDPDWTVGLRLLRDGLGGFVVADVRRTRASPADVTTLIYDVAKEDGEAVVIGLPRDPGQAGLYQVMMLTRMLAGFRVQSGPEVGSKSFRAGPVVTQFAAGNVRLKRGAWNAAFLEELATFPHGKKDDQVDALSRAFSMLLADQPSARYDFIPFLGR